MSLSVTVETALGTLMLAGLTVPKPAAPPAAGATCGVETVGALDAAVASGDIGTAFFFRAAF
jgi:hypothetical protein